MSTYIGKEAEQAVAEYLVAKGYKLITLNWRNRYCEIDIIAEKKSGFLKNNSTLHFIEVKYRKSDSYGSGLSYITDKKLQQMMFAAEQYMHTNSSNSDSQLDAVEVSKLDHKWTFNHIQNITM